MGGGSNGSTSTTRRPGGIPITTRDGRPGMARVDTFADVLAKYETHPESKVTRAGRPADVGGRPSGCSSAGPSSWARSP